MSTGGIQSAPQIIRLLTCPVIGMAEYRLGDADMCRIADCQTRQNWSWALRAVARAAGKDPAAVPAHPEFLRALFKHVMLP